MNEICYPKKNSGAAGNRIFHTSSYEWNLLSKKMWTHSSANGVAIRNSVFHTSVYKWNLLSWKCVNPHLRKWCGNRAYYPPHIFLWMKFVILKKCGPTAQQMVGQQEIGSSIQLMQFVVLNTCRPIAPQNVAIGNSIFLLSVYEWHLLSWKNADPQLRK